MKNFFAPFLTIAAAFAVPSAACAASITNLDTIPYDILVKTGGSQETIHIDPNQTWHTDDYDIRVRYRNQWMSLNFDSAYAIWKGGSLTEQSQGPKMHPKD